MPRMDKLSKYRTTVTATSGATVITYVSTPIVSFDAKTVTLDSGGFETVTTKRKMNQASNQFGLGYSVFQKAHRWYVTKPSGETIPFSDGITFERV